MRNIQIIFSILLFCTLLQAENTPGPDGLWLTFDEDTGKKKSVIEIIQTCGELRGIVRKIHPEPGKPANPRCSVCEGKRKNKPVVGMAVITGMKKTGKREWGDGTVLDPENGKTYRCKITLSENGKELNVRGFIGFSLFGRTQTWKRIQKIEN